MLPKYKKSTRTIQEASCFCTFSIFWNVESAREWDLTMQMVWWYYAVAHFEETLNGFSWILAVSQSCMSGRISRVRLGFEPGSCLGFVKMFQAI